MARRRNPLNPPRDYVSGTWPKGRPVKDAPPATRYAQFIAAALSKALKATPVAELAEKANLNKGTIYDIVNGATWPDIVTVALLADVLGVDLFPTPKARP